MPAQLTENSKLDKHSNAQKLVFVSGSPYSPSSAGFTTEGQTSDIKMYVINADGTGLIRLTKATAPEYGLAHRLSDGREATINWTADGGNIWSIRYESGCSPDGTKIAFVSRRFSPGHPNEYDVYVVNADGTGLTRLTYNKAWKDIVTWVWAKDE